MRSHFLTVLLVLSGAIVFAGCIAAGNKVTKIQQPSPSPTATTYADGVRRITIIELQELIKKNGAFIVDVRNEASYNAGHIPGAKLIPAAEILNHLDELPKDKLIVTYCS